MFLVQQAERRLDEANEKALSPVCSVNVSGIFAQLHAKASAAAEAVGVKIENTAADGNDPKTAVFHSAGEHMIVARSQDEGVDIDRKTAVNGLRTYIGVFLGQDVAKKLPDNEIFKLQADDSGTTVSESAYSLLKFLSEQKNMSYLNEDSSDDIDDEDDIDNADEGDDADDASEGDDSEDADEEDDEGNATEGDDADDADDADDSSDSAAGNDNKSDESESGPGFYVIYGLKVKGLKETTVQDALKQWGSNFLKGFGVTLGSMWGGGGGEAHTIGKLMKGLRKVFGAIDDPKALEGEVQSKLQQKFPNLGFPSIEFRDKNTVIADLDKQKRVGYDGKAKQKIKSAEYSLCIHVEKDDPKKPFLNRKILANIVTLSISGLFKKFKNKVSADDIIYLAGPKLDKSGHDADYRDTIIPSPDKLLDIIKNEKEPRSIWISFDSVFSKIIKTKKLENDEQAKVFYELWQKFKKDHNEASENTKIDDYYEFVEKKYLKAYAERQTNENMNTYVSDMFDLLFENGSVDSDIIRILNEADGEALDDNEKRRIIGSVQNRILSVVDTTVKAKRNKVRFSSGMSNLARVELGLCDDIMASSAAKYGIIDNLQNIASDNGHKYYILAYMKVPKQIQNKDGKTVWKGTPGFEGFNDNVMKSAFKDAVGQELTEFKSYDVTAKTGFAYNKTSIQADVHVYAGFIDAKPGEAQPEPNPNPNPQPSSKYKTYFAVSDNFESPDPTKIAKLLNNGDPVTDLNDNVLNKLKTEAQTFVDGQSPVNEADDESEDVLDDEDDDTDMSDKLIFDSWVPAPGSQNEPNGKVNDEPALIICAKFKKQSGSDPEPNPVPDEETGPVTDQANGDDLYIIPMPGVKYDDTDDEGFTKTI